ncbi:5-methylcytosine restriction system specificity protein McrC [Levilactobacillus brevis]|uniref:5-methylcytosine restriction system specificity protein McrC n=1 Tax=Levilactobacillus brevis TaxID=1580 RepID=UPI00111AB999|nr:guanosine 5'-monophosphate oxidoreductase [Levilactobacillus brevis]QCZ46800.1 Hypothetical protein UCCLB556_1923 [Levilactobacillus brevis]
MKIKVLDNTSIDDEISVRPIVSKLSDKSLGSLAKENFIIFPQQSSISSRFKENKIFQTHNGKKCACNVVGILSDSQDELRINSRFSNKNKDEDFFIRYMIQEVLNYHVVSNRLDSSMDFSYYDLLIYLFPYYLNEAMSKGIYKEYVQREYNDANIKGPIDIFRQIKINTPFVGTIAYRTREFSYDNNVTQLVRHTIDFVQRSHSDLLSENEENIRMIKFATPDYRRDNRESVLERNILNPVKNSYFEEYSLLQRLCIQILSGKKVSFGDDDNQIYGIIIDVSWLWEEYIGKVTGWAHFGRGSDLGTMHLFENPNGGERYPDFVVDNIPIDTKYKENVDTRNDYNQVITYIHIMNETISSKNKGGFLKPTSCDVQGKEYENKGLLRGLGGELFIYSYFIPQECNDYSGFIREIKKQKQD